VLSGGEILRGIHQCDVRDRLRKVTQETLGPGVVLLRKQPDIVADIDQAFEQVTGGGVLAAQREVVA